MSDINKRIHENAAKLAKVKAGGCGTCGGYGETAKNGGIDESGDMIATNRKPCPTCAILRKVAEYHWHEVHEYFAGNLKCDKCNCIWSMVDRYLINPHYIMQDTRQLLEELGEWKGFVGWHLKQCMTFTIDKMEGMHREWWDYSEIVAFDIATSDQLMRQAVDAYLEHRVGEVA